MSSQVAAQPPVTAPSTSTPSGSSAPSSRGVQLKRDLAGQGFEAQSSTLAPVQMKGGGDADVHAAASRGTSGGGGALPFADKIQKSFGAHDVSHIQAHTGPQAREASQAMGAEAFATGDHVAFGKSPDLHTAAHEAAHIVQQQAGVSLAGGVGKAGDGYEQHADQVADAVVQGKSAEGILDKMAGGGKSSGVQRRAIQRLAPTDDTPDTSSPAPEPPLTAAEAKAATDALAADFADLSEHFARTMAGKTKAEFDRENDDAAALKNKIVKAFLATGAAKDQTQVIGRPDPIAVQKFADVEGEQHLAPAHLDLKDTFYTNLATEMGKSTYVDRTRTFSAMQAACPPATFAGKGTPVPTDRISPHSARNHSVERLFTLNTVGADIDAAIEAPLVAANARPETIAAAKADGNKRKKAYRHLLATGRDPLTTIDTSQPISAWGTWFAPGEITPNTSEPPNAEFARMMTLGALQPEWYPHGTVVLNITRTIDAANRTCLKPTAFDGMMSSLWCARNLAASDYGVTGGGLGEFLEANVLFSEVTSATAIIPSDDFLVDMQRAVSEVRNELGQGSTVTEEVVRGNAPNILNTSPEASGMYGGIVERSRREQTAPQVNQPVAPGATNPTSPLTSRGPAAAPGGVW